MEEIDLSEVQAAIRPKIRKFKKIPSAKSRVKKLKQKLYRRTHRSLIRRQQRAWRKRNMSRIKLQRIRRRKMGR